VGAHPYGPAVLVYSHASDFFAPADVSVASDTLRLWLEEDFDAARAHAAALSPEGASEMKHVFDHDTAALSAGMSAEIDRLEPSFGAVSPSAHLAEIGVPVFLLHGAGDRVIPPSETEWLARHTPANLLQQVLISKVIEHVELEGQTRLTDKVALIHFMSALLEACEEEGR
jgi:pimeloyl-ACP methyl ester carboxylesterase